ncbi:hypothetical protein [uncultured Prevotella sp.]|uniref:hypothetical protein n=1 Tax=uncultured Prevotella sp. TaxID=159272 RepID=UPI002603074D|nr:hypothetical protein [uncultured Prevotella sp.]
MKQTMVYLLGLCALLAACSQDDAFTGIPEGDDAETVAVTLTAQADCSMTEAGNVAEASAQRAATRADGTDDPMPTRYYAEVIARDGTTRRQPGSSRELKTTPAAMTSTSGSSPARSTTSSSGRTTPTTPPHRPT